MFKIGYTSNIYLRTSQIIQNWGELDLKKSHILSLANEKEARVLEASLHSFFRKFNIKPESNKDGYSEWYYMNCYHLVLDEISRINRHYYKGNFVKGINFQVSELSKKLRKKKVKDIRLKMFIDDKKEDNENWSIFNNALQKLLPFIVGKR